MTIKDTADKASSYAKDKVAVARTTAAETIDIVKSKTGDLVDSARSTGNQARVKTAAGVDANPVAALIGGLALGALAAAVLPRTRKEDEILGGLGGRINDTARDAAQAAKDAGRDKLDELGINKDTALDKAKEVAQSALGIAKETANAAAAGAKSS